MASALDEVVRRIRAEEPELRRRGIAHLSLFGSLARGEERSDSDVDIAVEVKAGHSFSLIRMEDTRLLLQDLLGRPVDLGEIDTFRPLVRAAFDHDRVPVF
jgi:predicted nucleotidyltransferase